MVHGPHRPARGARRPRPAQPAADHSATRLRPGSRFAIGILGLSLAIAFSLAPSPGSQTRLSTNGERVLAQGTILSLPDVQTTIQPRDFSVTNGRSPFNGARAVASADLADPQRLLGQEGFGDSLIELQSMHTGEIEVRATFASKIDGRQVSGSRRVTPGGSTILSLQQVAGLSIGSFAAQATGTGPFGAIVRTGWSSGAGSSFAGVPAAQELLLPLMLVDTFGHTSILALMNGHQQAANQVNLVVRENDTGGNLLAFGAMLEPLGATTWDTKVETILFGPSNLPRGGTGGYLGALWVKGQQPVSLLAYGDETSAGGSSAIVARPVSDARTVQHLPLVRRGAAGAGGTLIAVANAERSPASGTIRYLAADGTIAAEQPLSLAPQGALFIDLTGRGRGTMAAPALPEGFSGAARIELDQPVLAAAQDEQLVGGAVDALSGYNALSPEELGTTVALPAIRRMTDFVTSELVVHNAGDGATSARLELFDAQGAAVPGQLPEARIPAGGSTIFDLREVDAFPAGLGRARIVADQLVAVLQRDSRDTSIEYPLPVLELGLSDERNSDVEGRAIVRTVQGNTGIRVDIQLTQGETGSYEAYIQSDTCSNEDGPKVFDLSPVVGGRSGTVLPEADLRAVADGAHAIRLTRDGRRGTWRVACGIIPIIRGAEVADTTLARGFVLERAVASPATATTEPTALPTQGPTPTPKPTVDPASRSWLYLPRALNP